MTRKLRLIQRLCKIYPDAKYTKLGYNYDNSFLGPNTGFICLDKSLGGYLMRRYLTCLLVALMLLTTVMPAAAAVPNFPDLNKKHWAYADINRLASLGYVQGDELGAFRPDEPMTRAEFVKTLMACLGNRGSKTSSAAFSDIVDHWARPEINEAVRQNIVVSSEYPSGFKPDAYIPRCEAAALLVRALGKQPSTGPLPFTDNNIIERSVYRDYIRTAYVEGIMAGFPEGDFRPFDDLTRAQVCKILAELLDRLTTGQGSIVRPPVQQEPMPNKFTSFTFGSYRYYPDYVKLYIDSQTTDYYLGDAEIIDEYNIKVGGRTYSLNRDRLTIKLSDQYYDLLRIIPGSQEVELDLRKTDPIIIDRPEMADISTIYVGTDQLNLDLIRDIEFIIDGEKYRLSEVTLDASGNFIVGRTTYRPQEVTMIIDGETYEVNDAMIWYGKFVFYCNSSTIIDWVKVDDKYVDADDIYILKDDIAYKVANVVVPRRNLVRLGGRQYDLDSSIKCRYEGKIYDIDTIDFDTRNNVTTIKLGSTSRYYTQPDRYVFYYKGSVYQEGTRGVEIRAGGYWETFNRVTISDPAHFRYDNTTYDLINARIVIDDNTFVINDTAWRGKSQVFDIYLDKY